LDESVKSGYQPPARRGRSHDQTLSFAIIIGEIDNPFNALALMQLSARAALLDWDMTTFVIPPANKLDGTMEQVLAGDFDAVVLASAELSSSLAKVCRERALPVIYFNRIQTDANMLAVCSDNYGGGRLAAERLVAMGCRTPAYIGGLAETSTHLERRRGFLDTLTENDRALAYEEVGNFDYDTARVLGKTLFNKPQPPDGIFCANDKMAFALVDAADAAGVEPGRKVFIVGYDDVPMASWNRYQLTTISQQVDQMVDGAIKLIPLAAQHTAPEGRIEIVPAKLIIRRSG
jgi:DNA-binding LacI/PurR family transcriptional regulator